MRFDVLTIFPEALTGFLSVGVLGQAIENRLVFAHLHDLRDFTDDPHRVVDDRPYGGGPGMLLKVEPLVRGIEEISSKMEGHNYRKVLLSSQGRLFTQDDAIEWGKLDGLLLVCGRYEGVDERVVQFVDDEVSIGDYVLTGGEVAAAVIIEATARMLPGIVGRFESVTSDSFYDKNHLGPPQYTRPPEFRGLGVPEVLLSGDHARIERFREERAWEKTMRNRPDLIGLERTLERAPAQTQDLDRVNGDG
ncbi:MAG: tRNA (guanosine(37)-N1)-methyltransferase TrmD [Candidatus Bipolaricaulota bacterium]|nr:tRNA (guanosine(37)-N1)-methyltransferase TrmD [Candidatus Bipolaricaulota bacterium]